MTGSPCLTLPVWPGIRGWIAQRPKIVSAILIVQCLAQSQRDFIQQPMGTDAETHSQTPGGARGPPLKRVRKDCKTQEDRPQNQLSRLHMVSKRLKWQPGTMCGQS